MSHFTQGKMLLGLRLLFFAVTANACFRFHVFYRGFRRMEWLHIRLLHWIVVLRRVYCGKIVEQKLAS